MSFHALPVELVEEILQQCVRDAQIEVENYDELLNTLPSPEALVKAHIQCTPWYLSHVCSVWREICISNPSFWTHLGLTMYNDRHRYTTSLQRLRTQMERAGDDEALSVAINIPPSCKPDSYHEILDFLISTSQRWRAAYLFEPSATIHLAEPHGSFLSDLIPATDPGLPRLELLCITRRTNVRVVTPNVNIMLVEIASFPGMHHEDLKSVTSLYLFATSKLSVLSPPLTTQSLYTFVPSCPALVHLSLMGHVRQKGSVVSHLAFPDLRSLTLCKMNGPGAADFLDNFTLPSLHTLRIGKLGNSRLNFTTVRKFILRSRCQIHHLSLDLDGTPPSREPYSTYECTALLEEMPELQTLELDGSPDAGEFFWDCFFPAVFPTDTDERLYVPLLRSIKLGDTWL